MQRLAGRQHLPSFPTAFSFPTFMHYAHLALGLLLALPFRSFAQIPADTAPTATSRFYVGLAAYHSNFQNLSNWRHGDTSFRVPVQLTAGYQLRPRLALELGAAYSGRTTRYAYNDDYLSSSGLTPSYYQYSSTTTIRVTTVSALARYTLTRQPAHRLQVDGLGGFTLVHRNYYSRGLQIEDFFVSPQIVPFSIRGSINELLVTAGLGLRYRFTPRFGLNLDLTTNYNLTQPDTFNEYTGSAALGLRYRFGR
jgi:hypothetical protein